MSHPKALRVMQQVMGRPVETPAFGIKHDARFPALKYAVNMGLAQHALPAKKQGVVPKLTLTSDQS
jgi:hypothetical protein